MRHYYPYGTPANFRGRGLGQDDRTASVINWIATLAATEQNLKAAYDKILGMASLGAVPTLLIATYDEGASSFNRVLSFLASHARSVDASPPGTPQFLPSIEVTNAAAVQTLPGADPAVTVPVLGPRNATLNVPKASYVPGSALYFGATSGELGIAPRAPSGAGRAVAGFFRKLTEVVVTPKTGVIAVGGTVFYLIEPRLSRWIQSLYGQAERIAEAEADKTRAETAARVLLAMVNVVTAHIKACSNGDPAKYMACVGPAVQNLIEKDITPPPVPRGRSLLEKIGLGMLLVAAGLGGYVLWKRYGKRWTQADKKPAKPPKAQEERRRLYRGYGV
ncbi:MAG: hypothetical protein JSV86_17200 [Gemmatimonadota bacterium]|nr:MAG: hypothetical protein JSV86_17200 [Gemmatimonadota bacterium]